MMLATSIQIALRALAANKLRSALTMLGIIIGVAAVVTMISIGQGARQSVSQQVQALGTNLLTVLPGTAGRLGVGQGAGTIQTLTRDDALAIARTVPEVEAVTAEFARPAQVIHGPKNVTINVSGVTPAFPAVRNFQVEEGTFFTDADMASAARVAVLGRTAVERLFEDRGAVALGMAIKINRVPFRVIGILGEKGVIGVVDWDDVVFVPLTTGQRRLFGVQYVRAIYAQIRSPGDLPNALGKIETLVRSRHHLGPGTGNDFTIRNQAEVLAVFQGITRTMALLLGGIAAVSLLVGGIGIMNIMLVSVTERTREIGIRKAVGATQRDILSQFLVEAVLLSVLGGLVGALVGIAGSLIISRLAAWKTVPSVGSLALAVSFAAVVGIFFGIYPARRAAAQDPITALRYE